MRILHVVASAILIALATTAHGQEQLAHDKLIHDFVSAFNRGDMAAVTDMYADDAVVMPPGSNMIKGRDAIRAFWTKTAQGPSKLTVNVIAVTMLGGDAASDIGTFTFATQGRPQVTGKYLVIWRKTTAGWKLVADIWNLNE